MTYYLLAMESLPSYLVKLMRDNGDGTSFLQVSWYYSIAEAITNFDKMVLSPRPVTSQYDFIYADTYVTSNSLEELANVDFPELLL